MKKALIFSLVFMLAVANMSAAFAATISTGLTADTSGGNAPYVQAKWEALPDKYSDESPNEGAQFNPTGVKNSNKTISICAIVADPDGVADIQNVYADVFYPEGIAVGPDHTKLTSQTGSTGAGCGVLMQEDELTVLSKTEGLALFCDSVRNHNTNLPTFGATYTYDAICKADGTLQKETAKVFCVTKDLSYEDPAGTYTVWAVAQDKNGRQGTLKNQFEYMPLTAFGTDFSNVAYGSVRLNTEKIINGNLDFYVGDGLATVRNVGNTRAALSVTQDDMKLGMTGSVYNVSYKARIGNEESDWTNYAPNATTLLKDELNLSETDEIDFGITVHKFPPNYQGPYTGSMTLSASSVPHLTCPLPSATVTTGTGWSTVDLDALGGGSGKEWFAKARNNNGGFELAIGINDTVPSGQSTADAVWVAGQTESFTLSYNGSGSATLTVAGETPVTYAVGTGASGFGRIGINVKAPAGVTTVVDNLSLSVAAPLSDDDVEVTGGNSVNNMLISGVDLNQAWSLTGTFVFSGLTGSDEYPAVQFSID